MKVVVDRSRCSGLGMCESVAPAAFQVEEDGQLTVLADDFAPSRLGELEAAVAACPTEALHIVAQ